MLTLPQRINLGVGVVLAFLSTSATAYYLFTVTGVHGAVVQYFSAGAGTTLEVARYSLSLSRERVLPVILFVLSVGCSWSALNLGIEQLSGNQNAYLIQSYKDDRKRALAKAAEFDALNYKTKSAEQEAKATALLAAIQALETPPNRHQQQVNQLLIILIAVLVDVVSVRCLLLGSPASNDAGQGDFVENPEETSLDVLSQPEEPPPVVVPIAEDTLTAEARELISTGQISNSKNAIKKHFRIGWERAVGIHSAINQEDKCEQS